MIHKENFLNRFFQRVVQSTALNTTQMNKFQAKRFRDNFTPCLSNIANALEIQDSVTNYAIILFKKLSEGDACIHHCHIFKIVTVCLIISQKIAADEYHSLQAYSLVTGIPMKELASLEIELFQLLNFKLVVKEDEYFSLLSQLKNLSI